MEELTKYEIVLLKYAIWFQIENAQEKQKELKEIKENAREDGNYEVVREANEAIKNFKKEEEDYKSIYQKLLEE